MGIESEWPGECHGNGVVSSECRWSTQMGVRGHGFCGVGTVCYLCRVCNLSIAESTVTDMLESKVHHGSTLIKYAN